MPQFLVNAADLDTERQRAVIRGSEAKHCTSVVRLATGDPICITDGAGHRWAGTCATASARIVEVVDLQPMLDNEPMLAVELLQGLPKGDRWEAILEKGTELGVSGFRPLYTARSVPRLPPDRLEARLERWQEKTRAALKQCERSRLPRVSAPESLASCLQMLGPIRQGEARLFLAERTTLGTWPLDTGIHSLLLAVGPEGGWTTEEQRALTEAEFRPVSVGPRILRADTAAVVGIALVMEHWGDLVFPHTEW